MIISASRSMFSRRLSRVDPRSTLRPVSYASPRLFSTSSVGALPASDAPTKPEKYDNVDVVGTVPYHTSYTLLRHSRPPSTYPSKLDADFSKLGRELMVQATRKKAVVNFWWGGPFEAEKSNGHGEQYPFLTFFFPGPNDPPSLLGVRTRSGYVSSGQNTEAFFDSPDPGSISTWSESLDQELYLLVCTHGSRDCRCSDRGGRLVEALKDELSLRRKRDGEGSVWDGIRVGEVAHVGGHKYAANLLVFPFGDWLAQVTPEHVPQILDIISYRLDVLTLMSALGSSQEWGERFDVLQMELLAPLIVDKAHWRGRSGLTKEEQLQFFNSYLTAT